MSPDVEFFYCPYCSGTDLVPTDADIDWSCRSCLRAFTVTLVAVGQAPANLQPIRD